MPRRADESGDDLGKNKMRLEKRFVIFRHNLKTRVGNMAAALKKYNPLLIELVSRDIKVRYRKSVLGMLWTVLNPLLMMCVITVVFSTIFKQNIPNFPIYYLSGSLIFSFNSEATTNAMHSILSTVR